MLGNSDRVEAFVEAIDQTMRAADDVEAGLQAIARQYLQIVVQPEVLRLRRLVIGEAGRFPGLARAYYERVPQRAYSALATMMNALMEQDRLRLTDPVLAANHFAWFILGMPIDRGMFYGPDDTMTNDELDYLADAAVRVFMAAYGTDRVFKRRQNR